MQCRLSRPYNKFLFSINQCAMSLISFLDYGILERHSQLDDTIGVLDMEMESYEKSKLMAWIFYPTWILLTIVQAICFILYNGRFHPLSKILDGKPSQQNKKLALKIGIETYQILTKDDEVCIPSLSSIFLAVTCL